MFFLKNPTPWQDLNPGPITGEPFNSLTVLFQDAWYFDLELRKCRKFKTGGPGSGGNLFETEDVCKKTWSGSLPLYSLFIRQ
jgi:hypothetical protein